MARRFAEVDRMKRRSGAAVRLRGERRGRKKRAAKKKGKREEEKGRIVERDGGDGVSE
jgi:hypothetical protein